MKVKTITQSDPTFLKIAYANDHLIDLQNHERFVNTGEKFMRYDNGIWKVYKMTPDRIPRLYGKFKTLHTAIYRASLSA